MIIKKTLRKICLMATCFLIKPFVRQQNLILISSKHGYTGNAAAFVDAFQSLEKSAYRILWMGNKHNIPLNRIATGSEFLVSEAVTLCRASVAMYTHVPADVSVYLPRWILRVNMWHGNPIKYILDDTPKKPGLFRKFKRSLRNQDPKESDLFLSGGKRFNEIMQQCTGLPPARVLSTGLPRNNELYIAGEAPHQPVGKVLFAPTFRDKSTQQDRIRYLVEAWRKVYRQQGMRLLIKLHPNDNTRLDFTGDYPWVSVCEKKDDINQLLVESDFLISDYSSVVFDYLILKRPVFLLMDDFADYLDARGGTYIDRKELETIFNCHKDVEQLVEAIIKKNFNIYVDDTQLYNRRFDINAFLQTIKEYLAETA